MDRPGIIFLLLVTAVIVALPQLAEKTPFTGAAAAFAQGDWKSEFEDVCSKTQDAMTFSKEELNELVARCDKLKPLIEKLDESQRKVYLKRLQLCRNLFVFVLGSKEAQ